MVKKPGRIARWFARTTDAITEDEVVARLQKIERALDLQYIGKPQAEVTQATATAAAQLIAALDKSPQAAIQIGNLLILKVGKGQASCVIARTLSQREMALIEAAPELLGMPGNLLRLLNESPQLQSPASEPKAKPQT